MTYDAIVVGARCGGAPLAMLLARRGHRVLLVDRAARLTDPVSTHYLPHAGFAGSRTGDCSTRCVPAASRRSAR